MIAGEQVDERDVAHIDQWAKQMIAEPAEAVDHDRWLGVIKQLERQGAGTGPAALRFQPVFFEGQLAKRVIDEALYLANSPRGPSPDLRQAVIEHRDAAMLRHPGHVPVEAGIVDQHNGVGAMLIKRLLDPGE